jgi:hypothetical protein
LREYLPGVDRQLVLGAAAPSRLAVDHDLADLEPDQVEIEAAEALGSGRIDGRLTLEAFASRVVGDLEVVVIDVVTAVAVLGVVLVPDPGRPGRARLPLRLRRRGYADQQHSGDDPRHQPRLQTTRRLIRKASHRFHPLLVLPGSYPHPGHSNAAPCASLA